jgi:hypothetical protein
MWLLLSRAQREAEEQELRDEIIQYVNWLLLKEVKT